MPLAGLRPDPLLLLGQSGHALTRHSCVNREVRVLVLVMLRRGTVMMMIGDDDNIDVDVINDDFDVMMLLLMRPLFSHCIALCYMSLSVFLTPFVLIAQ